MKFIAFLSLLFASLSLSIAQNAIEIRSVEDLNGIQDELTLADIVLNPAKYTDEQVWGYGSSIAEAAIKRIENKDLLYQIALDGTLPEYPRNYAIEKLEEGQLESLLGIELQRRLTAAYEHKRDAPGTYYHILESVDNVDLLRRWAEDTTDVEFFSLVLMRLSRMGETGLSAKLQKNSRGDRYQKESRLAIGMPRILFHMGKVFGAVDFWGILSWILPGLIFFLVAIFTFVKVPFLRRCIRDVNTATIVLAMILFFAWRSKSNFSNYFSHSSFLEDAVEVDAIHLGQSGGGRSGTDVVVTRGGAEVSRRAMVDDVSVKYAYQVGGYVLANDYEWVRAQRANGVNALFIDPDGYSVDYWIGDGDHLGEDKKFKVYCDPSNATDVRPISIAGYKSNLWWGIIYAVIALGICLACVRVSKKIREADEESGLP